MNNNNNNMMGNMNNMKNNNQNAQMNFRNNQMNNNMMMNNQNMNNNNQNNFNNGNNMINQNNFNNGNGNQNMMNQNNFNNQMGNNNNMNFQFERKKHKPNNNNESVICIVNQESNSIDRNEVNEIKNIVQLRYSSFINDDSEKNFLSDLVCHDIKKKLQGEWFVFVSDAGQRIPFSISTVSDSEFLDLIIGKTSFRVARIK